MNKLHKSPYSSSSRYSRAYQLASHSDTTLVSTATALVQNPNGPVAYYSTHDEPHAKTPGEQYWAARALRAEALLEAGASHKRELRQTTLEEEAKRKDEFATLRLENAQRIHRLEVLLATLVMALLALAGALAYALVFPQQKPIQSRWVPSHFTVPILSPFASVVENETSLMSTRLIVSALVVAACLVYAMFRHWIGKHSNTT